MIFITPLVSRGRGGLLSVAALMVAALFAGIPAWSAPVPAPHAGQDDAQNLPLPDMSPCSRTTPPPAFAQKWQSGVLLQHFSEKILVAGEVTFDSSVMAQRFTLAGIDSGSGDYLLVDGKLYQLKGYPDPTQCTLLRETPLELQDSDWLQKTGTCVGEAPVMGKDMIWWKTPGVGGELQTNWYWLAKDSDGKTSAQENSANLFRAMFTNATNEHGILGMFTFDYFQGFEEKAATNLPTLVKFCQESVTPTVPSFDYGSPAALLSANSLNNDERSALINAAVPGLEPANPNDKPVSPLILESTSLMVSVNRCYWPFPTRVYYDWQAQAQSAAYWNLPWQDPHEVPGCESADKFKIQTALLLGNTKTGQELTQTGFVFNQDSEHSTPSTCHQVLPGLQAYNWMDKGNCTVMAQLKPASPLNPLNEQVKILYCPITDPGAAIPQIFWTWYGTSGKPVVFMQSHSNTDGTGLNLADYYGWIPGQQAPTGTFDIPPLCQNQKKVDVPAVCHKCHLPYRTRQDRPSQQQSVSKLFVSKFWSEILKKNLK